MTLEGFSWLIEGELAGMAYPANVRRTLAALKEMGIGAVVSLTPSSLPHALVREHQLSYLHLPIDNFMPPLPTQVERFIGFCEMNLKDGRAVLVHCLAGLGRTGTLLACYLVRQGMEPQEAIDTVRGRRPGSIETREQELAVLEYAARLAHRQPGQ